eukprot:jgi/Chlat1/4898/Chrsp31S04911
MGDLMSELERFEAEMTQMGATNDTAFGTAPPPQSNGHVGFHSAPDKSAAPHGYMAGSSGAFDAYAGAPPSSSAMSMPPPPPPPLAGTSGHMLPPPATSYSSYPLPPPPPPPPSMASYHPTSYAPPPPPPPQFVSFSIPQRAAQTGAQQQYPSYPSQMQQAPNRYQSPAQGPGGVSQPLAGGVVPSNRQPLLADGTKAPKAPKPKALAREAAGQKWEDATLLEWPENDFRLFCGNLGNEVNDDVLTKAFMKFSAFNKAKVVRDKRTNKTKGYGFVSFADAADMARAIKEMNGKYVGNRPVQLRTSTWQERTDTTKEQKKKKWEDKQKKTQQKFGALGGGILHK